MTQIKNPIEKNINTDTNNNDQNSRDTRTDRSQEVDLPVPEKKNDDITTGINGEKPEKNTGQTGQKPDVKNDETAVRSETNKNQKTGFDPENSSEPARKDKRGDEPERLERDDTTDPKTKDADWQQDKMNEANNQQGSKLNVDKAARLNDTRDDSILDRPKTETYEKEQGENVGGKIKKENPAHGAAEKKRDDNNRKNQP
ncbi:MAG TPA: hypothetical protein PK605_00985 [Ignavibacteria bacterium]|nr:hypothetical protein [Bacteroidota bacterium]HRE09723.1 hypothetical protein [Ignavibacteria bacterium]HRF65549.1 hypothetical protein [Ignavibacteria bacterium]HRJ02955.1 hypothetical protein [Ignavibacteria bacterium]HRJ84192.1 hypothetical protein [Ignavibacteria bacterium]